MKRTTTFGGLALAGLLVLLWSAPAQADAGKGALDGKTFTGEMTEKGKTKGDKDTFTFKDGKFRSTACDAYGFTETAYTATANGSITTFEATAQSPKEGTMKWKGTIKGGTVEGSAVWTKMGQADMNYTFKGTEKK